MNDQGAPVFFGDWLKQRRKALDLTQSELAQQADCSVFALRKIEAGERRPSKQLALLLARSLKIPTEEYETFIRVARAELSAERLRRQMGVVRPVHTAAPSDRFALPSNLPMMSAPLLGRETELASLTHLLHNPNCRLLTLIGPGGIGKTRLALEAADQNQAAFLDGVYFIPLASLSSPAYMVTSIADAVGFSFQGQSEPRSQLLNYLSGKQVLLLLDNVEHLLQGVELFAEILQRSPAVKMLVTSRERLNLQSEWVFEVLGLPVPADENTEDIREYSSVALFVQSAQRAQVGFELHAVELPWVVRICQMVEGTPLGIELAAGWVSVLTCQAIAHQIERSLDFLTTTKRDVPERQRSLRAAFDHSWSLLSDEERRLLSWLAIFEGGFTWEAAQQVAGATLEMFYVLSSKSLVRHKQAGRYDLHEVVRQFALAHLREDPSWEKACELHSQYYLAFLHAQEQALRSATQREAIHNLKDEMDNLRAAWMWAIQCQKFALIGEGLRSFGWFCNIGVLYRQGIEQIESVVQALRTMPRDREQQVVLGVALAQQGLLYFRWGGFDQAMARLEESLAILRPIGDPVWLPDPLVISGIIMHLSGDLGEARNLMEQGLASARAGGEYFYTAYALYNLGYIDSLEGHYEHGYEQMLEGLDMWRKLGDPSSIALGLNYISPTVIALGRFREAREYLEESIQLLEQVGERWGLGTAYRLLGVVAMAQGNLGEAQALLRKSLDIFQGYITGWDVARSLIYLGEAILAAGDACQARQTYQQALKVAMQVPSAPLALEAILELAILQAQESQVEQSSQLAAYVASHSAGTYQTTQRARQLLMKAREDLEEARLQAAREWGCGKSLGEVAEALLQ